MSDAQGHAPPDRDAIKLLRWGKRRAQEHVGRYLKRLGALDDHVGCLKLGLSMQPHLHALMPVHLRTSLSQPRWIASPQSVLPS